MNATEYSAKLHHAANVIERLGVVPLYSISWTYFCIPFADFQRVFAGKEARRFPARDGIEYEGIIDGIKFCADEEKLTGAEVVTLPAEAAA